MDINRVLNFLMDVDKEFPVPLSKRINIQEYSEKLCDKGDIFIKSVGDEIVGFIAGYATQAEGNMGYISIIAVKKEYRKQGIADELVEKFLERAKSLGKQGVHVYTYKNNLPARKMYYRCGFIDCTEIKQDRMEEIHMEYLF